MAPKKRKYQPRKVKVIHKSWCPCLKFFLMSCLKFFLTSCFKFYCVQTMLIIIIMFFIRFR